MNMTLTAGTKLSDALEVARAAAEKAKAGAHSSQRQDSAACSIAHSLLVACFLLDRIAQSLNSIDSSIYGLSESATKQVEATDDLTRRLEEIRDNLGRIES